MAYTNHYQLADDVIAHLNTIVPTITNPFLVSRYAGFVTVVSVTVYELAIKEIFIDFGEKKHKVLGEFTRGYFDRINGRIRINTIRNDYIPRFGEKYVKRFNKKIKKAEEQGLRNLRISISANYGNIITWRNDFAHEGVVPATVTYGEVAQAYEYGKEVIKCLAETMRY